MPCRGPARRPWSEGRHADAAGRIAEAVELVTGDEQLVAIEQAAQAGEFAAIGLLDFAADRRAHAEDDTTTNASPGDMID